MPRSSLEKPWLSDHRGKAVDFLVDMGGMTGVEGKLQEQSSRV